MNKPNLRSQRAITLIALIITIIVLLILAVVTIGSIKHNNIITYAQNAANDYNKEKDKEESTISGYESLIEQYIPSEPTYITYSKSGIYGIEDAVCHLIELSDTQAVLILKNGEQVLQAKKLELDECSDITELAGYEKCELEGEVQPYTRAAYEYSEENEIVLTALYSLENWIIITDIGTSNGEIVEATMILDEPLTLNTEITKEEVKSYIELAK